MIDQVRGICWPHTATVGHLTVTTPFIRGHFPALHGNDGIACCDITPAGKYRNGAARSWCRTHQHYWGVKADLAALAADGVQRCARHAEPVHYAIDPLVLDLRYHARVRIALEGDALSIHIDEAPPTTHAAIAIRYDPSSRLFPAPGIVQVNVTPAAVAGLHANAQCVCCSKCGHPHLDLGSFGATAHKRHYCGQCGNDSTHSKLPIVSNPLAPLLVYYRTALQVTSSIVHTKNML